MVKVCFKNCQLMQGYGHKRKPKQVKFVHIVLFIRIGC